MIRITTVFENIMVESDSSDDEQQEQMFAVCLFDRIESPRACTTNSFEYHPNSLNSGFQTGTQAPFL